MLDSAKLFRPIDEICKTAQPLEPLWGYFLYKKAITSIVSDPGLGKSTLGYKMSIELSSGRPFLGIMPEEPIKALDLDFESSDSLVKSRKILVHGDDIAPNFIIYNIVDYFFPQIINVAKKYCLENSINFVLIDNQTAAFNTHDENDNSEAAKQMRLIRAWVNDCNVACLLFHHTSKANLSGTRKGTGAFARARLADICINLDLPNENVLDVLRWEVVKNRMVDEKTLWYLKKTEGRFEFTEQPLGSTGVQTNTQVYAAQKLILTFMQIGMEYKFSELVTCIAQNGIKETDINNAVHRLYQQGRLIKPKYGYWCKR